MTDPAQISDLYSNYVIANIIETTPAVRLSGTTDDLKPRTAAAMAGDLVRFPHVHRAHPVGHLFRGRPGVQGNPARTDAADYVYQLKRVADLALEESKLVDHRSRTWSVSPKCASWQATAGISTTT